MIENTRFQKLFNPAFVNYIVSPSNHSQLMSIKA